MRFVFSESMDEMRLEGPWPGGRESLATFAAAGHNRPPVRSRFWLKDLATGAATDILTALFPTDCLLCAGPMTTLAPERVCAACVAAVQRQNEALCMRCGEALGMESARFAKALGATECTACRLAPPSFERAVAYAAFDGPVRELIHLLKFGEQRLIAERLLGPWLGNAMLAVVDGLTEQELNTEISVVPVPMFAARERRRGFNQATLLAKAAIQSFGKGNRRVQPGIRFVLEANVLQRVRDTEALYALAPHQRRRSLKGAFRVSDADRLRGRVVVLVDDIMTTGSTARECARVLRRAGAQTVVVATVARAQAEGVTAFANWSEAAVTGFGSQHGDKMQTEVARSDLAWTDVARWDG